MYPGGGAFLGRFLAHKAGILWLREWAGGGKLCCVDGPRRMYVYIQTPLPYPLLDIKRYFFFLSSFFILLSFFSL